MALVPLPFALWRDARGRLSALRIGALVFLLLPVALAAWDWWSLGQPPRALNDLIHRTGYWALIFVLVSLGITPLRRVARWTALLDVRRMIGVGAFCYAFAHLLLYIADQAFDLGKVASEIVLRLYLTVGFVALLGLAVLAATSTDGMVRRLGGRGWQRLHWLIYPVALLGIIHFFQQTKLDVTVPSFIAAFFGWLMLYRLIAWRSYPRVEPPAWLLLVLTLMVTLLTFIVETGALSLYYRAPPLAVLQTALDFDLGVRPGWVVLASGLAVVALDLVRARLAKPRRAAGRTGEVRPAAERI